MDASVIVKLVPAEIAEIVGSAVIAGTTHVGEDGRSPANDIGNNMIRLWDVTAVVFTVYVVVVVGMTNAPAAADPHAAGDALFTEQLVDVL